MLESYACVCIDADDHKNKLILLFAADDFGHAEEQCVDYLESTYHGKDLIAIFRNHREEMTVANKVRVEKVYDQTASAYDKIPKS